MSKNRKKIAQFDKLGFVIKDEDDECPADKYCEALIGFGRSAQFALGKPLETIAATGKGMGRRIEISHPPTEKGYIAEWVEIDIPLEDSV